MMSPQNNVETESGEPSSYQHMEQALSQAVSSAGQASRESMNEGGGCHAAGSSAGKDEQPPRQLEDSKKSVTYASSDDNPQDDGKVVAHDHVVAPSNSPEMMSESSGDEPMIISEDQARSKPENLLEVAKSCSLDSYAEAEETLIGKRGSAKEIHPEGSAIGDLVSIPAAQGSAPPPVSINGVSPRYKPAQSLRRGKWTVEEEAYVARVIQDFNSGFLNAPAGTTLRSYLSDKLQCDPMRITKKFTGDSCIGKRVFHPAVRSTGNSSVIDKAQAELDALERRWRRRLEMQNRESAKKAAASAAAANSAAPVGRRGMVQGGASALDYAGPQGEGSPQEPQNALTQTASWLDRANAILRGTQPGRFNGGTATLTLSLADELGSMPSSEIEDQMREVQRLIYEGPLIQQTTADLPHLLDRSRDVTPMIHTSASEGSVPVQTVTYKKEHKQNIAEPADKRLRTGHGDGAEDAEALVGFLRSVRASAASGQDP